MAASSEDLDTSLFVDPNFDEKALRFATDAASQVVYITKERYAEQNENGWSCSSR